MKGEREFQATGGRTTLEINQNVHSLTRDGAKLQDEGQYSCTVQNAYGKAVANVEVTVLPAKGAPKEKKPKEQEISPTTSLTAEAAGPPTGEPRAEQVGLHSLRLTWGQSTEGSGLIEGYKVEYRTPDTKEWISAGYTEVSFLDVKNLKESTEYMFRVTAKSKVDWGTPREMKAPVKTLALGQKPKLSKELPEETRLDEGNDLVLEIKVEGKPEPTIRWLKDNLEVEESRRIIVKFGKLGSCQLTVKNVDISDDGVYTCTAENESGFASTSTNVVVVSTMAETSERYDLQKNCCCSCMLTFCCVAFVMECILCSLCV